VPESPDNGYSAAYELDWIALENTVTAGFTASPTVGIVPLTVVFTNTSIGDHTASLWDFGDEVTSTLASPTHTYQVVGVYTVTLAVSGIGGTDTWTRTRYITVTEPPPVAGFTAHPTYGFAPLTVAFTDTTTGAVNNWLWDFGDSSSSVTQNPTHTYTTTGVYTVSLWISGPGGTDTLTRTNYITVSESPPVAAFTASPLSGALPLTVYFTDTSSGVISNWLWSFGDGLTSTVPSPTHTYNLTGTFGVTLTVTGPGGSNTHVESDYIHVSSQFKVYLPLVIKNH
jgi:PKD repeat protein